MGQQEISNKIVGLHSKSSEAVITPVHNRRAKIAIVVVCVCSLIYNASRFAEYSYMSFHFDQEVSKLFFPT